MHQFLTRRAALATGAAILAAGPAFAQAKSRIGIIGAGNIGASVGGLAGAVAHRPGLGAGVGGAAGAAAGLTAVLLTRGPDLVLPRGGTLEMILDRPLVFTEAEIDVHGWRRQ